MTLKLLTEHHLEFLSLKRDSQARLSLHLSKCHIVGNHMSQLILYCQYAPSPLENKDSVFHLSFIKKYLIDTKSKIKVNFGTFIVFICII